jgi:hypothetical protein
MECRGRHEKTIAEQKAHQIKIHKLLFVAQPSPSLPYETIKVDSNNKKVPTYIAEIICALHLKFRGMGRRGTA